MKWEKLGLVFCADEHNWWMKTHAYFPTPLLMEDRIRVYCSFFDDDQIKRIGFVDIKKDNPLDVIGFSTTPVLDVGSIGTFSEHGVIPSQIQTLGSLYLLYYTGWQNLSGRLPRYLFSSLVYSDKPDSFPSRIMPTLERKENEPYMRSVMTSCKFNGEFKLFYVCASSLMSIHGHTVPNYGVKCNDSYCLFPDSNKKEFGFGRPWPYIEDGILKLFYSIRVIDRGYRIGYAESYDGKNFFRKDDEVGIEKSSEGWDSEQICFSSIIDIGKETYMFYNGNDMGRTGFGVARRIH